jgi:hypothetical protein
MSEDFGAGCIATAIIDNHFSDDWYEEFDPGFVFYDEYIRSPEWKAKADAAKEKAGYRCQVCNGKDRLEAHHRNYDHLGDERPEDITVLCHACHEIFSNTHKIQNWVIGYEY